MEVDTKLSLEDALDGSPQSEQLLQLFEHDSSILNSFSFSLLKTYNRVSAAYHELLLANQQLSKHLKLFKNLNFSLNNGNKMIGEVLGHFATHLDEMSSHCHLLSSQLADSVVYPLTKLTEADLRDASALSERYAATKLEHDEALSKYMKLSKKREVIDEKVKVVVSNDVFVARKKMHQVTLHYFSSLNLLQYKRASNLLESALNYATTQKLFAASCHDTYTSSSCTDLIQAVLETAKSVSESIAAETVTSSQIIPALESEKERFYHPEPIDDMDNAPDLTLTSKTGYLFYRSKSYLISHWSRCFVIIQLPAGHLLIQMPGETAASLLLDLTEGEIHATPADVDDRRWTFEVIAKKSKKQVYFQAENQKERDEWVGLINHVAGSTEPSPESSQQPSTPDTGTPQHHQHTSIFSQLRRSLIDTTISSAAKLSHYSTGNSTANSASKGSTEHEDLSSLPVPEVPIQFDLSSNVEEFPPLPSWLGFGGQNTGSSRANPFGEKDTAENAAGDESENANLPDHNDGVPAVSSFAHTFPLRFVGSVRIDPRGHRGQISDHLVCDTIRQILAARAIHGIFRMSEVNMLIATDGIYLLDAANSSVKARYPLHRIVHVTAHQENNRLFAFVSSSIDSSTDLTCHIFESNVPSESIIDTFNMIEQMTGEAGTAAVLSSIAEIEQQQGKLLENVSDEAADSESTTPPGNDKDPAHHENDKSSEDNG